MIPSYERILTCPQCGKKKEVLSLATGNTFRSVYWSDFKTISPMLPYVSEIQKCPHCGNFYFLSKQEIEYSDHSYSFELGTLTFEDCIKAQIQFEKENLLPEEKELLLYLTITAYNDKYYRSEDGMKERNPENVSEKDFRLFELSVVEYIEKFSQGKVPLKAELLREVRCYKKSIELFESYISNEKEPLLEILKKKGIEYAKREESKPFILYQ